MTAESPCLSPHTAGQSPHDQSFLASNKQQASVAISREDTSQLLLPGGGKYIVNAFQNPPTELSGLLLLKGMGWGRCGCLGLLNASA